MNTMESLRKAINSNCIPKKINREGVAGDVSDNDRATITNVYLTFAIKAIEKLEQGALQEFDALCGDTACQKRAIVIAELYNASAAQNHSRVQALKEACQQALDQGVDQAAENILDKIQISLEEQIMVSSHILTLTRDKSNRSITNAKNLESTMDFDVVDSFVFKLKESISTLSVAKTQKIAAELPLNELNQALKGLLGKHNVLSKDGGRTMFTPCTFNNLAILQRMRERKEIAILSVKHLPSRRVKKIVLQGDPENGFVKVQVDLVKNSAAVIFEGIATDATRTIDAITYQLFKEPDKIERYPGSRFMEIVLANASMHPQYWREKNGKKEPEIPYFELHSTQVSGRISKPCLFLRSKEELIKQSDYSEKGMLACIKNGVLNTLNKTQRNAARSLFRECPHVEGVLVMKSLFDRLQVMALNEGLCKSNPLNFQILHIYANTVAREMNVSEFVMPDAGVLE